MPNWLIIVAILVAVLAGLAGNRWVRRSRGEEHAEEGFGISDVVNPVTTLAVVLLAFIVVEAIGSYGRAREDIGQEARAVDTFGETALRVADPRTSADLQENAICYARAVRFREWDSMADGERAPEVGEWTGRMQHTLAAMRRAGGDDELDRLIDIDTARAEARLARITESNPTLPIGLNGLMFASVVVSALGLALFGKRASDPSYLGGLAVLAILLSGTLYMINDLDSPFAGVNKLQPTELSRISIGLEEDYLAFAPDSALPCDSEGRPYVAAVADPSPAVPNKAFQAAGAP